MEACKHAYTRAKERLSWSKKTVDRMAPLIWETGVNPETGPAKVQKWIENKSSGYCGIRGYRIHGEYLFIYSWFTLITMFPVPKEILALLPNNSDK